MVNVLMDVNTKTSKMDGSLMLVMIVFELFWFSNVDEVDIKPVVPRLNLYRVCLCCNLEFGCILLF